MWTDDNFVIPAPEEVAIIATNFHANVPESWALAAHEVAAICLDFFNTLVAEDARSPEAQAHVFSTYLSNIGEGNLKSYASALLTYNPNTAPHVNAAFGALTAAYN